jgi:hypothetical protein
MGDRFVRPGTTLLTISGGDTLTVKTRLTHGERADSYERQYITVDGELRLKPGQIKLSMVTAYLVDWSLTDPAGARVAIYQQPVEVVEGILRSLAPEDFDEIHTAITTHETQLVRARAQEKKRQAAGGDPISRSPSAAAGVLTGSVS